MKTIPVFYSEAQVHDAASFSKSPLKPGLLARRIGGDPAFRITGQGIAAVSPARLLQVHDADHVDGVLSAKTIDGFGNRSIKSITAIRHTVGNFLAAANWAVTDGANLGVVWSLTSGFHHSRHDSCGGFCTFDALTLSAYEMQKHLGLKTLLVDEDAHYGDGCEDIIKVVGMGEYCQYLQSRNTHGKASEVSLTKFATELGLKLKEFEPDVIFYQAGADNWIGDPLGGALSIDQLYIRDLIVFSTARRHGIPVVCNLAGGYAKDYDHTLTIHMNTGAAMKNIYLEIEVDAELPPSAIESEYAPLSS